jgi:GNAT superfamily N-acetyltransferase
MSGEFEPQSGRAIHPESRDLTVELRATVPLADEPDSIWTKWTAQLKYPGELIAGDLDEDDEDDPPNLVLATAAYGSVDFQRLLDVGIPLLEALDADSGDYAAYCPMASGHEIADDLAGGLVAPVTGMVIADRVTVPEPFRGRRYGLLLMSVAIMELGRERLVVCTPAAFEVPRGSPKRTSADRRNVNLWKAFGFHQFRRDKTYFLDTATSALEHNLDLFQKEVDSAQPLFLP